MISATRPVAEGAGHGLGLARHAGPDGSVVAPGVAGPPPGPPQHAAAVHMAFGDAILLPAAPKRVTASEPFLRPLPKPAPMLPPRFNGVTAALNGCRVVPIQTAPRISSKYHEPPPPPPSHARASSVTEATAINLAAHHKDDVSTANGDSAACDRVAAGPLHPPASVAFPPPPLPHSAATVTYNSRLFPPPPPPAPSYYSGLQGSYGSLYPAHYSPLLSRSYVPQQAQQQVLLEVFRPRTPPPPPRPAAAAAAPATSSVSTSASAFLGTYSPPASSSPADVKPGQSVLRERRAFKIPSGKEGSLKHHILTRPTPPPPLLPSAVSTAAAAFALSPPSPTTATEAVAATCTDSLLEASRFARGSLIRLESGELRRVEDLCTEDFVCSAKRSPLLRLNPSTVVRIDPGGGGGNGATSSASNGLESGGGGGGGPVAAAAAVAVAQLTLSYGESRAQAQLSAALDRPFFVFGQGWASLSPERTLLNYGLRCARLRVGDVCVSLTPRTPPPPQLPPPPLPPLPPPPPPPQQPSHGAMAPLMSPRSPSCVGGVPTPASPLTPAPGPAAGPPRKRRWSAPDHIHKAEEEAAAAAAAAASASRRPKH